MLGKFSVKKPYTVLVAVVLVIVLGVVSFTKMTTDLLPNISLPYVIVMTAYPGASPETVEMVVTKPVEASMATVSNIEEISSISGENYSMVIMEFAQSTDMNAVSLEIRENLDQIKSYWDDSIGSPIIMKLNPDMLPVMIAAVGGKNMTSAEVTEMTQNKIIPELESIEGVASASATGLLEESVNVIIRQEKIDRINKQVFGSIDKEMEDAKQELEDSKQEVYDGQAELEDAKKKLVDSEKELEENQQKLVDSQTELEDSKKELEDSKKEIADGRAEISENRLKLEDGKSELANKKAETTQQIAEMETQLLTAKADLEATKIHLTSEIATMQATNSAYKSALEQTAAGKVQLENGLNSLKQLRDTITELNAIQARANVSWSGNSAQEAMDKAYVKALALAGNMDEAMFEGAWSGVISNIKDVMQSQFESAGGNDKITELQAQKADLEANTQTMRANITANEAAITQMQSTLASIEEKIVELDAGLSELYAGNLTAAIEFANAQTGISIGELQISSAEAQLDAAEKQIESGQKQLDSAQEQIDEGYKQLDSAREQISDGYEQLKDSAGQLQDALEQIAEGEENLNEAWENAYDQADMQGILTVDTIKALLAAQNFSMPAGYVTEEGISYLIRVGDKPKDIEILKKMPIMNPDMDGVDMITLEDVADVFMTDNSAEIYARVNGEPGIMVSIQKQTGYSTGDVSDRILKKFKEMTTEDENLMLITLMDQGIYIDLVMNSIINNITFGAMLAILILILFLKDIRPTAVIACSIPISLITAIVCMYFSGVTLNVISLSGLALGIGMLVDNSIVVIENIYRLRKEGQSAVEAAVKGAGEVAGAIMASTLTTVCVFLPIVFTEGITRQLFVDMGLTIGYSLMASLLIALTVVPAMASKILVKTKEQKEGGFFSLLNSLYTKVLSSALSVKPLVLILVVVLLGVSAYASYAKGTAFMPEMDSTQMSMTITLPEDTPLAETAEVTDQMTERLMKLPDVQDIGAMTGGSDMSILTGGGETVTNVTQIYLALKEDKKTNNNQLADEITEMMQDLCDAYQAEIAIETSAMDMSALTGSGISVQIRGRDLDTLQELAMDISKIVEGVEGTENVTNGLEDSTGEMRIIVDRDKAIEHGLTVAEIFQQISSKLASATSSTTLETEIKEYDVYVKHGSDMKLTRRLVQDIEIERKKQDGTKEKIPLKELAAFENTISPDAVNRIDQNRYISVTAQIADGYNIGLVSKVLEKELDAYKMPGGYSLVLSGENEMINEAMGQLYLMMLLALIFMYLIMVAQFQSLLSPFIIMFTIPLAFTGGFLGLVISGSELSVIALIGFVMLSGIIVNNGIVLVDYMNQLRSEGMEKREAILTAGQTRVRPVLMTALTTILALCTMVFSGDMGSELGRPMAIVTIGGLIYGTLLTLVVIPCIYDIFSGDKKRKKHRKAKVKAKGETENAD